MIEWIPAEVQSGIGTSVGFLIAMVVARRISLWRMRKK